MPAITATDMTGSGSRSVAETTLDGTDSLTYNSGKEAVLILRNPTASAITPVIDGDAAGVKTIAGIGDIDLSAGYDVGSIAAGAAVSVPLDSISAYLAGAVAINSGTGLVAALLEF